MKVELLDIMGDDTMVANAARVSYQKEASNYTEEQNKKLLKYLYEHNHWSPFSHPQLQFRIECPIYVERQLVKTEVGRVHNCLSGETEIKFIRARSSGGVRTESIKDLYKKWMTTNGNSTNEYYLNNLKERRYYLRDKIKKYMCRVLDESTNEFTINHIKDIVYTGVKTTYTIKLSDGSELRCTPEHRILTSEGWKTISEGLEVGDKVAKNGVKYVGTGSYQKYDCLKEDREMGLSVQEMAEKHSCSYHTIRKWLKIHGLSFDPEDTYFKKGFTPWNKGVTGYTLNVTEEGLTKRRAAIKFGEESANYKDGSGIRNSVSNRYRRIKRLESSSCCECGSRDRLAIHHVCPVTINESRVSDENNIVIMCHKCHVELHKTNQGIADFYEKHFNVRDEDYFKILNAPRGVKMRPKYVEIVSIEEYGEEDTYDIEMEDPHHNFIANGIVVHNSISGRYVDFSDTYTLVPEGAWRQQSKSSKQGSEGFVEKTVQDVASRYQDNIISLCKEAYNYMVSNGVAKEQARTILPLCLNTTMIWTGSLWTFIRLYKQRIKPDAQKEIQDLVQMMMSEVEKSGRFKNTLEIVL